MSKPTKVKDKVKPSGRWQFDQEVTDAFDDMLERSIPQYEVMRRTVTDLAAYTLGKSGGGVLDIGCSRGGALAELVEMFPDRQMAGVDASEPMVAAADARFGANPHLYVYRADLRDGNLARYTIGETSCVLSVLTLQFVPIEYRLQILGEVFDLLAPGGALVVVEKLLGESPFCDRMWRDVYHAEKSRHGYPKEAITRKAASLEGVLVPVTARANEEMLSGAGFRPVECFWRWCNFAGWYARKPSGS